MEICSRRQDRGFTLVEFAVVLIIIGLLIGGVLKGGEMITKAKIKRVENECATIAAAIDAYRERFGALPGDDPAASTRFAGDWRGADNGNGDGWIMGGWSSASNNVESRKLWKHLRGAGLIDGPVDHSDASFDQPRNAFGGLIGIGVKRYNMDGHSIVFGEIPGDVARILDTRHDDGIPSSGSVQSHASQSSYDTDSRYVIAFRP